MAVTPPRGTVTFLFTDIEGSTSRWEADPQAMQRAVAEHDRLLRDEFEARDGYVFTTAGDSFAVAFAVARDAVDAAVAVQRRLETASFDGIGPLAVRIGVHTGVAELRDNDYFGPDVNLAARVMGAGHGGQIVVSESTLALTDAGSVDLGVHELKGITEPQPLHQVVADGLRSDFPPLRTGSAYPSNLPEARVELLGRDTDVREISKLLADRRLVTLIGPGGVGKTSLAMAVARDRLAMDGTWLVDLAPVETAEHIPVAVADAIGLAESGQRDLVDQITSHLETLDVLVVVDNCEHVIDAAADLIDRLLARTRSVHVLATSREVLDLPDESVRTIAPLPLPADDSSPDSLRQSPALRLLDLRARSVRPEIDLLETDPVAAAEVCRLVDGLPLAIELAGARLRSMSVQELAGHLRDRLSVLSAGRGRSARHRTLDAVLDWSYGLLDEDEKQSFELLSVFAGGWTATAAAAVLPGRLGDIEMVARLVDKSLVVGEVGPGGTRYRMLETLRSFAADHLERRGTAEPARDAHLEWALELVGTLERDMRTPRQDASLRAVRPEHDNLRTARTRAIARNDVRSSLRITASAPIDTNADRQHRLVEHLAHPGDLPRDLLARARYTALGAAFEGGDFAAGVEHGREATRLFDELGDRTQGTYAQMLEAFCRWSLGEDVTTMLHDSLAVFDQLGDVMGRAYLSWTLSQWELHTGGDLEAAVARGRLAVDLFTSIDAPYGVAHATEGLGHLLAATGDLDAAMVEMRTALAQLHDLGIAGCMAHALDGVAFVLVGRGHDEGGAELVGAARKLRENSGAAPRPWEIDATERCIRRLRSSLDGTRFDEAVQAGRALGMNDVIRRAAELDASDP